MILLRDLSRRALLVSIGSTVISPGLLSGASDTDSNLPSTLPPGVYDPSSDHLGHALMSSGRFHPIPPGCPTDYVRPETGPFTPEFFSPDEFSIICRITELILDQTTSVKETAAWIDLQVASAAGIRSAALHLDPLYRVLAIAYFGPAHVTQVETVHPEQICREGIAWLLSAARSRGADHFLSLAPEQQAAILSSISDERPDLDHENAGTRLFAFLKVEVIRGYYTSQAGLKELDFKGNAFYARSPGCNLKG